MYEDAVVSHIVAVNEDRMIGKDGGIPWHVPSDLAFFRSNTIGKCVVMGRATYDSIGAPLPDRKVFVATRDEVYANKLRDSEGIVAVGDLWSVMHTAAHECLQDEVMIAGGAQVYEQTMSVADRVYMTIVPGTHGDDGVYYPEFEGNWIEISSQETAHCVFKKYERLI